MLRGRVERRGGDQLNGNLARLEDSCLKLTFSGEFGTTAGGTQGFFGSYELNRDGHDALAVLSTVPAGAASALTVELQDVAARVAVGPVLLHRTTVPLPAPNPC